ncbi:MAG: hypothetical protein K2Y39_08025 [Candidatus Obscuribacterales bacterium]|nr:hypothetical protein [Candidatus Obscuribacterales bacterium]
MKRIWLNSLVSALFALELGALDAQAWTLAPMKVEQDVKPGDSITDVLAVDNSGATDIKRYDVKIVDWSLTDDGELTYLEPGSLKSSVAKGITCSPMQFKCAPGEKKLLRYTLNLPPDLKPGEYTAGIQVLEVVIPPKDPTTGKINVGVAVKCGFLSAISVVVPNREVKPVEAEGLEFKAKTGDEPLKVILQMRNSSNVRVRPLWSFEIRNKEGQAVFKTQPTEFLTLRDSVRRAVVPVEMKLQPGDYKVVGRLDQGFGFPVQELEKDITVPQ